jgi:transposase-like protein
VQSVSRPTAGVDYPSGWDELNAWFPDDEACLVYLERLRWPDGFVCRACGVVGEPWRQSRGRLTCSSCRHQSSVTAGTIFEKTRTPLRTWFAAVWYVTNQKSGASALGLQRVLGLGSYETAWLMLHKLRRAMVRPERAPLDGVVEVDETYVGGAEEAGVSGRQLVRKALVVIAVELRDPRGFGRVRMRHVQDASSRSLVGFVREVVAQGAAVKSDGWSGYGALSQHGFDHEVVNLSRSDGHASAVMPGVHRVASLLKRWLMGTHHGAVRAEQLGAYLEEFTFRFNRRTSRARGLLFYHLLEQAVATLVSTYTDVVGLDIATS